MRFFASSLVIGVAAAGSLSDLDDLAHKYLGPEKAAPFIELNRKLQESGSPDITTSCAQLADVCKVDFSTMTAEQMTSMVSMSSNDQAAQPNNLARFLSEEQDPMCMLKAVMPFYCDVVCADTCTTFLAGDASPMAASGNDDSSSGVSDGSGSSNDMPSFMTNPQELADICTNTCLKDLLTGVTKMSSDSLKCGEGASMTANDGAEESPMTANDGAQTDPTAQIEDVLGKLCVKNNEGSFCMVEMGKFGQKHPKAPDSMACTTPAMKDLVAMGCCFGSMIDLGGDDSKDMRDAAYYVTKCGGSTVPCSAGATKDVAVIESSLSLSAEDLTQEDLEKPEVVQGIQTTIATQLNVDKTKVHIESITIMLERKLTSERKLAVKTADVKYSVVVPAAKAAAVAADIKKVDNTKLTSDLASNVPALSSATAAQSAASPTTKTVTAEPEKGSTVTPFSRGVTITQTATTTAMLLGVVLAGVLM